MAAQQPDRLMPIEEVRAVHGSRPGIPIMGTTPQPVPPSTPAAGTPLPKPPGTKSLNAPDARQPGLPSGSQYRPPPVSAGTPLQQQIQNVLAAQNVQGGNFQHTAVGAPIPVTKPVAPPAAPPGGTPVPKPPGGNDAVIPGQPGATPPPNPSLINPGEGAWNTSNPVVPGQPGTQPPAPGGSNPFIPGAPYTGAPGGAPPPNAGGGGGSSGGRVQLMDYQQGMSDNDRDALTREVTDRELTSRQLERLLDENGRYIQNARLNAREQAAAGGMLMSSTAAGAAQRAAIDAGAPIAQADASVYANTASENMRAQNEDAMADQGQGRQLFGQTMGLRAQLDDSAVNRTWQSGEAARERSWRSSESGLDRAHQVGMQGNEFGWRSGEAGLDRMHQYSMQEMQQMFQRQEGETERQWRDRVQALDQQFTGEQNSAARQQGRFDSYVNMQANREAQLAQTLAAIYSNPNLKPDQQAAAAANARAVFSSMTSSFNAAFAQGVPPIFYDPYPMNTSGNTPLPGSQMPPVDPGDGTGGNGSGSGTDEGLVRIKPGAKSARSSGTGYGTGYGTGTGGGRA